MADLIIYRSAVTVATVSIDEKTILTRKLMNEDKVVSDFVTGAVIPIAIRDYITINSKNYYINQLPNIEKVNEKTFKYNVVFQSDLYDLYNKLFTSVEGLSEWSYTGNALDFLTKIVEGMNEISSGWAVGTVDASDNKLMDFINENCRTALTKISSNFNFEFEVNNKVINFKEAVGTVTAHTFKYGKNNGLYSIERRAFENKNIFTRVYGYGSTRNIPYTYRDRQKRLVFEERFLEKNVSIYGIREGQFTDENIYPHRTGTITAVNNSFTVGVYNENTSYIEDSSIDFLIANNLNGTPKIVFKSGDLSGQEFEIMGNNSGVAYRIYIKAITERDGLAFPNETSKPEIGDTYTIVDIEMPASYIRAAEQELKDATQVFLDENSVPKSLYFVKIDPKYAKLNSIVLDAGDLVFVNDAQLGVDRAIRIAEVSFPIVNPNEITAIIADFIPYTLQQLVAKNAIVSSKAIQSVTNKITNISTTGKSSTVTNIYNGTGDTGFITINNRKFKWVKGFDNNNIGELEIGDTIAENYWNRILYVVEWHYLGGTKEFTENWEQVNSIELPL